MKHFVLLNPYSRKNPIGAKRKKITAKRKVKSMAKTKKSARSRGRIVIINPRRKNRQVRRNPAGGMTFSSLNSPINTIKAEGTKVLSKDNATLVAGAIGAGYLTNFALLSFGKNLPFITNRYGVLFYKFLIPVLGASATRKFSPRAADGMLIAAGLLTANELLKLFGKAPAPFSQGEDSEYSDDPDDFSDGEDSDFMNAISDTEDSMQSMNDMPVSGSNFKNLTKSADRALLKVPALGGNAWN